MLSAISKTAYNNGYNVFHIFHEEKYKDMVKKHNWLKIDRTNNNGKVFFRRLKHSINFIKYIESKLKYLKSIGVIINVIIIDYIDCFDYDLPEYKLIADLRVFSQKYNYSIYTAVQMGRKDEIPLIPKDVLSYINVSDIFEPHKFNIE